MTTDEFNEIVNSIEKPNGLSLLGYEYLEGGI